MKTIFTFLIFALISSDAFANEPMDTTPHPCSPRQVSRTMMNCNHSGNSYFITVRSMATPATPQCESMEQIRYRWASVRPDSGQPYSLDERQGEFAVEYPTHWEANFEDKKNGLNFQGCAVPQVGWS